MPPTDYRVLLDGVAAAPLAAMGLRGRIRAYWSRIFNRGPESVEGHRVEGLK